MHNGYLAHSISQVLEQRKELLALFVHLFKIPFSPSSCFLSLRYFYFYSGITITVRFKNYLW